MTKVKATTLNDIVSPDVKHGSFHHIAEVNSRAIATQAAFGIDCMGVEQSFWPSRDGETLILAEYWVGIGAWNVYVQVTS